MNSHDQVFSVHSINITGLAAKFSGHSGMSVSFLLHWLKQFDPAHVSLIIRLLENLDYFTRDNLHAYCETLIKTIYSKLSTVDKKKILFVVAADIWEGDADIARYLKHSASIDNSQLVHYTELAGMHKGQWEAIVFIKDFAGTGNQLIEWWNETLESLVLPLETRVILAPLILNYVAEKKLQVLPLDLVGVFILREDRNIFHSKATYFSSGEKTIILSYCEKTNTPRDMIKGYGECGLLVAFDYGCPNDSIPILWSRTQQWTPLFPRRS